MNVDQTPSSTGTSLDTMSTIEGFTKAIRERRWSSIVVVTLTMYIFITILGFVAYNRSEASTIVTTISLIFFIMGLVVPVFQIIPIAIYIFGPNSKEDPTDTACSGEAGNHCHRPQQYVDYCSCNWYRPVDCK